MARSNKESRSLWAMVLLTFGLSIIGLAGVMTVRDINMGVSSAITDRLNLNRFWEVELPVGQYFTIADNETNKVIDKIARKVYVGDRIITSDNKEYTVTSVNGRQAKARKTGVAKDIVWNPEWDKYAVGAAAEVKTAQTANRPQIGLYYTHSDESYVPTDGAESIPANGGIFKVGTSLADALKKRGVKVVNDRTPHEPHDAQSYIRSRRTATQLITKRPIALIDVHRDGIPDPDFYNDKIHGKNVTRLRLVVGKQNPNMATNLEFAKRVKAYVDKVKPGLVKEIFIGHGNYNQDLGPKAMLIEVGTHTNSRYWAENGANLFADALPRVLNLKTAATGPGMVNPVNDTSKESGSAWTTVAWILGIVLLGAAAFLFISTGSLKGVKSKLSDLSKSEFANYLGDGDAGKTKEQDKDKDKTD